MKQFSVIFLAYLYLHVMQVYSWMFTNRFSRRLWAARGGSVVLSTDLEHRLLNHPLETYLLVAEIAGDQQPLWGLVSLKFTRFTITTLNICNLTLINYKNLKSLLSYSWKSAIWWLSNNLITMMSLVRIRCRVVWNRVKLNIIVCCRLTLEIRVF